MTKGEKYAHVNITANMAEVICLSPSTSNNGFLFPLRLVEDDVYIDNFSKDFRRYMAERFEHDYVPEEILGYIYGILHCPYYRRIYLEFLRIDFPRVPFPETRHHFDKISALGWDLIQVHLLRHKPMHALADYPERGGNGVAFVRYSPAEQAIQINVDPKTGPTQRFEPVPQAVWDFHIGGYQVLDKYLKSRKGRTLTLDEINHVADIAGALQFTIDQMARIDEAYLAAFPS